MNWVVWQQHRGEALLIGLAVALLSIFLLITGLHMQADYQQLGVGSCLGQTITTPACSDTLGTFQQSYSGLASLMSLLVLLPAIVAILVGAPLVAREVEQGTNLLAWTQGITRQRWLLVKIVGVLLGSLVCAAIVALLFSWWRAPLDQAQSRLTPLGFDLEGTVPLAYMAFAMALAIAAGAILRRTVAAIAVTIVGFIGLRISILTLRYYILPPRRVTWDVLTQPDPSFAQGQGAWVIDRGWADAQGHIIPDVKVNSTCNITKDYAQCLHDHGWLRYNVFQPDDRYWALQGIESGIFLVLAAVLIGVTFWWVRSRLR